MMPLIRADCKMEGGAHFNSLNTAVSKNKMAVSESAEGRKEK